MTPEEMDAWINRQLVELPNRNVDREHEQMDTPTATALLHRTFPTYTESMWIQGYPRIKTIVVTCPRVRLDGAAEMPGTVRSIPVGWRDMATESTFLTRFYSILATYEEQGWVRKQWSARSDA